MNVGDKVRAKKTIVDPADGDHPTLLLCEEGDVLIVREVGLLMTYPIKVSHESVTDNQFGVDASEVERVVV